MIILINLIENEQNKNEIIALQTYLRKFGYYEDDKKIDGDYGDYTENAVKDFQNATGILKVDGMFIFLSVWSHF